MLVLAGVGCGGTTALALDAGSPRDGAIQDGDGTDASHGGADGAPDAHVVIAGRVPQDHRASGMVCPSQRGPGEDVTCTPDASTMCTADSQCTSGANGRCGSFEIGPLPVPDCSTQCSYDECFQDSDCGSRIPCECRASASSSAANDCVGGSKCATDADCGSGGYCSPSVGGTCFGHFYACHSPEDTCLEDTDCPQGGAMSRCLYQVQLGRWACGTCISPP
ncbi:MAG TPA: hypothetical protein VK762_37960 [Polyangiaceae bacterium]|nr:hypothetical protein [Polyangiaceae bacterium]